MSAESPAVKAVLASLINVAKVVKDAKADGSISKEEWAGIAKQLLDSVSSDLEQGPAAVAEMQAHPLASAIVAIEGMIALVEVLK